MKTKNDKLKEIADSLFILSDNLADSRAILSNINVRLKEIADALKKEGLELPEPKTAAKKTKAVK